MYATCSPDVHLRQYHAGDILLLTEQLMLCGALTDPVYLWPRSYNSR